MTPFGLTSTAFRSTRFSDTEVARVAAAGFASIEIVAAPGHFDPADRSQVDLIGHRAAAESVAIGSLSVSLDSALATLPLVVEYGWPVLVAKHGPCRVSGPETANAALAPALEKLLSALPAKGCQIAVQAPGGPGGRAESLVELLESFDDARLGICLDVGHGHLSYGAPEAAEAFSGLVVATRLHDNNGREDTHRAPGEGTINWPETLTACWKTGVNGPWVLDLLESPGQIDVLRRAVGARTRLQAILEDLAQPMTFTE